MPVPWNGQIASPPNSSRTACSLRGDLVQRLVPRDPLELARALRADAAQRVQQPVRRARVLEVAVDLRAQRAGGERVLAVAPQPHGLAVLDGHDPAAAVRAVERAGSEHISCRRITRRWNSRPQPAPS